MITTSSPAPAVATAFVSGVLASPMAPRVEVVVPVYNEEAVLERSIRTLHARLTAELPYPFHVTIADNASTDRTAAVATALAAALAGVDVLRLERKGRGRALRAAWSASEADVLCYMDVDLSTDLRALPALLAPLASGHSDLAIGSRLARSARTSRGLKRELISRGYNLILRAGLGAGFSDAQCGFKAITADAAVRLLPHVRDEEWFFDTELLIAAQRARLRIHEVPVDWVDDPDSRVAIVRTAIADLRGVARLMAGSQVHRFLAIGVVSTIAYALLFLALRGPLGTVAANVVALAVTAVANTQANRRLTFRLRGREGLVRQHAMGAIVFVLTLGLTSGALAALHAIDAAPAAGVEFTVLVVASALATIVRFVALRSWVFARRALRWRKTAAHLPQTAA